MWNKDLHPDGHVIGEIIFMLVTAVVFTFFIIGSISTAWLNGICIPAVDLLPLGECRNEEQGEWWVLYVVCFVSVSEGREPAWSGRTILCPMVYWLCTYTMWVRSVRSWCRCLQTWEKKKLLGTWWLRGGFFLCPNSYYRSMMLNVTTVNFSVICDSTVTSGPWCSTWQM